jgi:hypothetical protein
MCWIFCWHMVIFRYIKSGIGVINSIYEICFVQQPIIIGIVTGYSIFCNLSPVIIYLIVNWELWLVKCDCVAYSAVGHTEINQLIVPVLEQLLNMELHFLF